MQKKKVFFWISHKLSMLVDFTCSLLEMHLVKIASFSIMALCCFEVNALHLVVVVIILLSLVFGISTLRFSFSVIGPFLSLIFLSKMLYQTKFFPSFDKTVNCSAINTSFHNTIEITIFDPEWWGFTHLKEGETVISAYRDYILVFLVMTLQAVIRVRQKIYRIDAGEDKQLPHVLFVQTTRKDADKNLKECLKYLLNYGFYKFGVEVTLSFCVFLIYLRLDVFACIYALWIVILFLPSRATLTVLWPFFFATLTFSILWQYAMAVGLSKKSCFEYPWSNHVSVVLWMFLPSFQYPSDTKKTLVDFVLLLLIQRQQAVFELEKKYGDRYLGGSNKEVFMNYYSRGFENPTPDHTGNIRSWLDVAKFLFMSSLFRITLAFEFWNGASNANVLSLGFLVGAFVFLWIDYDLCLWHITKILKWWNILVGYTVFVIVIKTLMEFAGCIYADFLYENAHWFVELLFLRCSKSPTDRPQATYQDSFSNYWDFVCFTLVLFQRRYFQSYYFLHEVDDAVVVHRMQEKGAKFMDELQETKFKEFQLRERRTLMKIKKSMNRIKAWQKRIHGFNFNEPNDHATAIYMGDYLMFEDINEEPSIIDKSSSSSEEFDYYGGDESKKSKDSKKLTMTEFIGTVFKRAGEDSYSRMSRSMQQESATHLEHMTTSKEVSRKKSDRNLPKEDLKKGTDKEKKLKKTTFEGHDLDYEMEEKEKMKKMWRLFRSFLDSVMVSMIRFFNKHSKDFRYIESKMRSERKIQKRLRMSASRDPEAFASRVFDDMPAHRHVRLNLDERKRSSGGTTDSESDDDLATNKSSQTLLVNLINSISMFIMSKTELLCFVIIFLHTVLSPTVISLPLPLLVFLWGSLTTVRPTTTFWTVLIAYTEVTVVIKALFQNSIFPWNTLEKINLERVENPALYLGIRRDHQYVIADLFLLLLLFLHRYKLKTLGLWNKTHEAETSLPQNLRIYRELPSEKTLGEIKGNRSLVQQRKRLTTELTDQKDSITHFLQMATWKCTSRATAKLVYWKTKVRAKIRIKEIEGQILVTHEGRRLQPTFGYSNQTHEGDAVGNTVLRVYVNDLFADTRNLFCRMSWAQHFTSVRKFFIQILVRDWRMSADFYTYMFVFEFLDFLLVFFGYSYITKDIQESAEEHFNLAQNQVPIMYLFTVIAHFAVIIIDRILYLRKNVVGKLILQFLLIILVHLWMFVLIPIITESPFNFLPVPQMYYIISCFYFLMSAYQLRVGYPMRVQGHFLCKKYGYVNYYAYKGLKLIPFFNQLRTLLDYICIHTSLTMLEWIKMESIFQLLYENKCSRRADIYYPAPRGQECPKNSKYVPGIAVLFGIIVVIWLPFIIFALFNSVAQNNLPQEATLSLQIANYNKVYVTRATFSKIKSFTEYQFNALFSIFKANKKLAAFLSLFDFRDVAVLQFKFDSADPWSISKQDLILLNSTVQDLDNPIEIYLTWDVHRIPRSQMVADSKGYRQMLLTKTMRARKDLAKVFFLNDSRILIERFLPKFIHITNEGEAKPVTGVFSDDTSAYRNVTLSMEREDSLLWWRCEEANDENPDNDRFSKIPFQDRNEINIYTFNQKNIPKIFLNVSKRGIIGLYLSIVIFSWTFVKRLMLKYPYIMFDDMPNPDPVLKLCHDIYLARESHEFTLEEDLYAKLLFLFRSPETMIKVTRLNE